MPLSGLRWDVFCRVVDNFGDAGVCWRLAAELAARGQNVRLWIDDAAPLGWLAPQGANGVEVIAWQEPPPDRPPGDVVIEAFGCDPPGAFVARMKAMAQPPAWINLEYLSAESWVERNHLLPSPQQAGPGAGLKKWFFYPGFTAQTGGLLRMQPRAADSRDALLRLAGAESAAHERLVLLFCYDGAPLQPLLKALSAQPTLLLATRDVPGPLPAGLRLHRLAPLPQPLFDQLLLASDLNLVRGEDSFVQAQWAGRPFVWHIYPQHDGAHHPKLEAFLDRFLLNAPASLAEDLRTLHRRWNDPATTDLALPAFDAWSSHCTQWRDALALQQDLVTQLFQFVAQSR